jgi:hypothetical protein
MYPAAPVMATMDGIVPQAGGFGPMTQLPALIGLQIT